MVVLAILVIVRALDRMSRTLGLVLDLVTLAIELAADRVMPILVAFVPAMRRVDSIRRTNSPVPHLVGFLIYIARDLGDLDARDRLDNGIGVDKRWHRRACWNCKSSKRNCQRRANDNLSS